MVSLLWLITIILFVMWVLGFAVNIGAWVNFLLVAAVILLLFNVVSALFGRGVAHTDVHDTHHHHHDDI